MRELSFFQPREPQVPTRTVIGHYKSLSPDGHKELTELFKKVQVWHDTVFTDPLAQKAQVFYAPEIARDHPDHLLTAYGAKHNLMAVAQQYLALQNRGKLPEHPYIRNIQYFIGQLTSGVTLPHVIVVIGRIRQQPYIIDGNTRSIAAAVLGLATGGPFPHLKAYIGRPGLFSPFFNFAI